MNESVTFMNDPAMFLMLYIGLFCMALVIIVTVVSLIITWLKQRQACWNCRYRFSAVNEQHCMKCRHTENLTGWRRI